MLGQPGVKLGSDRESLKPCLILAIVIPVLASAAHNVELPAFDLH